MYLYIYILLTNSLKSRTARIFPSIKHKFSRPLHVFFNRNLKIYFPSLFKVKYIFVPIIMLPILKKKFPLIAKAPDKRT